MQGLRKREKGQSRAGSRRGRQRAVMRDTCDCSAAPTEQVTTSPVFMYLTTLAVLMTASHASHTGSTKWDARLSKCTGALEDAKHLTGAGWWPHTQDTCSVRPHMHGHTHLCGSRPSHQLPATSPRTPPLRFAAAHQTEHEAVRAQDILVALGNGVGSWVLREREKKGGESSAQKLAVGSLI